MRSLPSPLILFRANKLDNSFIAQNVPLSAHPAPRVAPARSKSKSTRSKHLSVLSTDSYPSKASPAPSGPPSPTAEDSKRAHRASYIQSAQAEHGKHSRRESPYVISLGAQVREVVKRRVQILKGDWAAQVIQLASFIFQAIIVGAVLLSDLLKHDTDFDSFRRHDLLQSRARHLGLLLARRRPLLRRPLRRAVRHG